MRANATLNSSDLGGLLLEHGDRDSRTHVQIDSIEWLEVSLGRRSTADHTWLQGTLIGTAVGVFAAASTLLTDVDPDWTDLIGDALAIYLIPVYTAAGIGIGLVVGLIHIHEHWEEQPKAAYAWSNSEAPVLGLRVSL